MAYLPYRFLLTMLLFVLAVPALGGCADEDESEPTASRPKRTSGGEASPARTAGPVISAPGKIVFVGRPKGQPYDAAVDHIYVANPDGTEVTRLTSAPGRYWYPRWSPDGQRIAFFDADSKDVYVIKPDGSGLKVVARDVYGEGGESFAWSPDGGRIAYMKTTSTGPYNSAEEEIFTVNVDLVSFNESEDYYSRSVAQVTNDRVFGARYPAWSPDGSHLAFGRVSDLYVVDADGSNVRQLTNNEGTGRRHRFAFWSPDSTRLAIVSLVEDRTRPENDELYVVNADGSELTRLTDKAGDDVDPVWSPDGARIAFVGDGDGDEEIYVVNSDGSNLTRLTDNYDAGDTGPAWSSDGTYIVYASCIYDAGSLESCDLYIAGADGSGSSNITNTPEILETSPDWSSLD